MSEQTPQRTVEGWLALYGEEGGPLGIIVSMLREMSLDVFTKAWDRCVRAETLGPLLEPTAWRNGGSRNVDNNKRMAEALLTFRRAIDFMESPTVQSESHP